MRSVGARIRAEIERAVAMILDQHVQGATAGQSREDIARPRATAGAIPLHPLDQRS